MKDRYYLFEELGGDFEGMEMIVSADTEENAIKLAKNWFVDPSFCEELTEEQALASELDIY